jgi:hypothetical protein
MTWSAHRVVKVMCKATMCKQKTHLCRHMQSGSYVFSVEEQSAYSVQCTTLKAVIAIKCNWSSLQGETCVVVCGNFLHSVTPGDRMWLV